MGRLESLPFFVLLLGISAVSMMVPASYALAVGDHATSRAFFYSGIVVSILFVMIALATANMRIRRQGRGHLISIMACYLVLPIVLAVPVSEAVPDTRFFNAYVEMVSSLTTTGLSMFEPGRLPDAVHLWRAQVAWLGGLFVWITAMAIMAPLNLGGFELSSHAQIGQGARENRHSAKPSARLKRYAARLLPIYAGLTGVLWMSLYIAGDRPLVALSHAMSTMSTSGISAVGGLEGSTSGAAGEIVIFLFFIFAISRLTFIQEDRTDGLKSLVGDPELRLGVLISVSLAVFLFLRHWMASFEEGTEVAFLDGLRGLWGALFTISSFLTTTGFVSGEWSNAQAWSGVGTPGVLLLGLAVFGGGVATTAGGVKLLRVFALYQHGLREMEKLVQPSSIAGAGRYGRRFRRQGAYAAWVFFMLFAISIAVVMIGFSLVGGLDFEEGMILTISALSTTGPLTELAGEAPLKLAQLGDASRALLCAAMVLGRLEALAVVALLNPEFWR